MLSPTEQAIDIPVDDCRLAGMLYEPATAVLGGLVFCNPIFEERKAAHRVLVEAARSLARAGFRVLRFDYRGCGDSPGAFDAYGPATWLQDIAAALAELRKHGPDTPLGLLGLRVGAAMALHASAVEAGIELTVLWEPVLDGQQYIEQELRRKMVREMVMRKGDRSSRDELIAGLRGGASFDYEGYPIAPHLYEELGSLNPKTAGTGRHLVVNISHRKEPSEPLADWVVELNGCGHDAVVHTVQHPPFWNLVGMSDCSELIERTTNWITDRWKNR